MAILNRETIQSKRLAENFQVIDHSSGLTLLLYPMEGFSGAYALFSTKYGSVDTTFKTGADSNFTTVPDGIAHFLEHKLFENENGVDAFSLYAETGASANAYTSFDRTAYLFSCTENFPQSLDILLELVTKPFFSKETVRKEQGIIGQEIKMYDDDPGWRVFFNLLGALYHDHPVRIDIAGSVESISKITPDTLYRCYNTFYNLRNMNLAVAGNFNVADVIAAADKILETAPEIEIYRSQTNEPKTVRKAYVEQKLPVAQPQFQIGFKGDVSNETENVRGRLMDEILIEIIAGECTAFYRKLYDCGLINQTFGGEAMSGFDYSLTMFAGESRDPKKVYNLLLDEIKRLQKDGIDSDMFSRCKKSVYGRYIGSYSRTQSIARMLDFTYSSGIGMYEPLDIVAGATLDMMNARIKKSFDTGRSALSVVKA